MKTKQLSICRLVLSQVLQFLWNIKLFIFFKNLQYAIVQKYGGKLILPKLSYFTDKKSFIVWLKIFYWMKLAYIQTFFYFVLAVH